MRRFAVVAVLLVALTPGFAGSGGAAMAEEGGAAAVKAAEALERLRAAPPPEAPGLNDGAGGGAGALRFDASPALRAALGEALYAHEGWVLEHKRAAFEWQLRSSRITFWLVIALTLSGLTFSALQFWKAHRSVAGHLGAETQTELEVSARGVRISSPVLGVVILMVSMGFFYLFLTHVYPIRELAPAPPGAAAPASAAPAATETAS